MASTRSKLDEIVASFATLDDPRSHINRRNRSHPESGCILNRMLGNPWHFSVNPCSIVNTTYAESLISLTVVNYQLYKVFINMSV